MLLYFPRFNGEVIGGFNLLYESRTTSHRLLNYPWRENREKLHGSLFPARPLHRGRKTNHQRRNGAKEKRYSQECGIYAKIGGSRRCPGSIERFGPDRNNSLSAGLK